MQEDRRKPGLIGARYLRHGNSLVLMELLRDVGITRVVQALDLPAAALTALRVINDRAAKFLNRLVARVGLEPTTSAL